MGKIYIVGIGPGAKKQMTLRAREVLEICPVIVGYTVYIDLIKEEYPHKTYISTPMRKERERCRAAFTEAEKGNDTAVICSGDAGIYGMAGLMYELSGEYPETELEVVPGITAATGGAALLGAPLTHDFAVVSLSDLLTPWEKIEKRLLAAAMADFVICIYNPSSKKRADYLKKACSLILEYKNEETVCGLVRNIGREGESVRLLSLGELKETETDMFTTVFIGNSETRRIGDHMVTPRGYQNMPSAAPLSFGYLAGDEEKKVVYAIGAGMGQKKLLTLEAKQCISKCDILMGSQRIIEEFQMPEKPSFCEYRPQKILEYLTAHPKYHKCAVLFSGDTGFFSGAKRLAEVLGDAGIEVRFLPGISSVVYLAACLNVSWEDAKLMSLHGREEALIDAVARYEKTFCLLGGSLGEELCRKLKRYDFPDVRLFIGRRLSYEDEEILVRSAGEVTPQDLEGLATVLIENPRAKGRIRRRPKDEEFIRGKIPMTKAEVRAASLAKLNLTEGAVFYDIGAGTGSVSVEAALSAEQIKVYAVEKNPEGIRLIEENQIKFKTEQIEIVEGEAPEVLEGLEAPTHVLIGGSSGKIKEILRLVRRKNPKAHVVIHAVSLETLREAWEAREEGLLYEPEIVQVSVAKARKLGMHHLMTGQNPVYIISDGIQG